MTSRPDTSKTAVPQRVSITVATVGDVARSVIAARKFAKSLGFDQSTEFKIGTAISELATNIVRYAHGGTVTLRVRSDEARTGIEIIVADRGPGIEDVEQAMKDGATTRDSLGLGLPGVQRLMDEFELSSTVGKGTIAKGIKWL